MVYQWGKQTEQQEPHTFVVKAERIEPQEPQEPRQIIVKAVTPEPKDPPQRITTTEARTFYTIPQLAELLQVHENTIYRLVRAGKIEHYKVGAQIRISAAELERLKVERKA